jgi:lysophospholipase L1-like esterase
MESCQRGSRVRISMVLLLVGSFLSLVEALGQSSPWIGTWAVSPVRDESERSFNQQTLRQIVHTSVGGRMARVRISNLFGTQPLIIEDVHLARRSSGSAIVAGTDRQVWFKGKSAVKIQPGTVVVSDPVDFHVPRLGDVSISIYLPNPTGRATYHSSIFQTSYIAAGDVSGSASLPNFKTSQGYYFLTNLDVQDRSALGSIVALGASITDGSNSTPEANRRWTNDLAKKLLDAGLNIGVLNHGISGNRLLSAGAGDSAETRFDRDVLAQPGVHWVIFSDDPINDLGSTRPAPSAEQLIAGLERLIARAHKNHVKFFCSTLTPFQGAVYWTPSGEAAREQINEFIRGRTSGCDAIVDQDTATHDPSHPTQFLPAYDSGDHLHPNDAGFLSIVNAINTVIFWR